MNDDQPSVPADDASRKTKPSLRRRMGGLAKANLNSMNGIRRNERQAAARSSSKSKPWMTR